MLTLSKFISDRFSFQGRCGRTEYLMFFIVTNLLSYLLEQLSNIVLFFAIIYFFYALILIVPSIAVVVRRLHDLNLSGTWFLALLGYTLIIFFLVVSVPVVTKLPLIIPGLLIFLPSLYLAFAPGKDEGNRYTIHHIE